jgi:hypothetical protein
MHQLHTSRNGTPARRAVAAPAHADQSLVQTTDHGDGFGDRVPSTPRGRRARRAARRGRAVAAAERQCDPKRAEHAVRAVHRRGAQPDQVHPPAEPFLQLAIGECSERGRAAPDRDARARRAPWRRACRSWRPATQRPWPCGRRDLHRPAAGLQLVAHPGAAAHHLDAGHRIAPQGGSPRSLSMPGSARAIAGRVLLLDGSSALSKDRRVRTKSRAVRRAASRVSTPPVLIDVRATCASVDLRVGYGESSFASAALIVISRARVRRSERSLGREMP